MESGKFKSWTIRDIINYMCNKDIDVSFKCNSKVMDEDGKIIGESYYRALDKRIKDCLAAYGLMRKKDESKKTSPIIVPEPFGRGIADMILEEEQEKRKKEEIPEIKKKYYEIDKTWTSHSSALYPLWEADARSSEFFALLEQQEKESREKFPDLYDENGNLKSEYEYRLPVFSLVNPAAELDVETIIDRTMLRALFYHFFDFKEYNFRKDLKEREDSVDTEKFPFKYYEGFSELSYKLENPLGYYIFPKNQNDKKRKKK